MIYAIDIHIYKIDHKSICRVTKNDGSMIYYNWDSKVDRCLVRRLAGPDTNIRIENNVAKGWNCDD